MNFYIDTSIIQNQKASVNETGKKTRAPEYKKSRPIYYGRPFEVMLLIYIFKLEFRRAARYAFVFFELPVIFVFVLFEDLRIGVRS